MDNLAKGIDQSSRKIPSEHLYVVSLKHDA